MGWKEEGTKSRYRPVFRSLLIFLSFLPRICRTIQSREQGSLQSHRTVGFGCSIRPASGLGNRLIGSQCVWHEHEGRQGVFCKELEGRVFLG